MASPSSGFRLLGFIERVYDGLRRRIWKASPLADLMEKNLPADAVILEAGAHAGADTVLFAKRWPAGTIHAFEPVPVLFAELQNQTASLPNVKCYPYALSKESGTVVMHLSTDDMPASSSILPPKRHLDYHPTVGFSGQVEVPSVTLDDWMTQEKIARLDALWLDLQGFEFPVMQASPATLSKVRVIVTEFADVELYAGQERFSAIHDWLATMGFKCIYRERLWLYGGNALFLRQTI